MPTYKTSNNDLVETESELGKGGEGAVHSLRRNVIYVAKIYHDSHRTPEKEQKLRAMISNPPKDDTRQFNPPHISIPWPEKLLYDRKGKFAGYLMLRIINSPEIFEVFNPSTRKKKHPDFDWRSAHHTAQNLALALNALHAHEYVMGDVNQKNVKIANRALVTLVDTDSFQVKDTNGRVYRCPVGVPEYTPPELHGKSFDMLDRADYHDNFGLAVLIFQLLMEGNHPFTAKNPQFSSPEIQKYCIEHGIFPYQANNSGFSPPPHAPLFESLHPNLQHLFLHTFINGYKTPNLRINALEWAYALEHAEKALTQCQRNPSHWYSNHLSECQWCKREKGNGGTISTQKPLTPPSYPIQQPLAPIAIKQSAKTGGISTPRTTQSSTTWKTAVSILVGIGLILTFFRLWPLYMSPLTTVQTATKTSIPTTRMITPLPATITPTPTKIPLSPEGLLAAKNAQMNLVPAGEFTMGDNTDPNAPIHTVYLSGYYIDKYEVTNGAYKLCVNTHVCEPPKKGLLTKRSYYGNLEFNDYPVIYIDWNMANAYCLWRGDHLPTEAEWEKAARGTKERTYPWGNNISCDKANYGECVGDVTKVGSYEKGKSFYGIYDTAGNVWEWVNDWYDEQYYKNSPSSNPSGPDSGTYRVLKGGSWKNPGYKTRSAYRYYYTPVVVGPDFGFRCARSP